MRAADIERIVDESSMKLLQNSSPSVRYWLLRDIIGKDREDASLQRAFAECERYPARLRLLRSISDDGTWPVPNSLLRQSGTGALGRADQRRITLYKNLLNLLHSVTLPGDERLELALERFYDGQSEDGYLKGPMTHGLPQPHFNEYALYVLIGFDKENDPRVKKAVERLMTSQRADGGWNMPYLQDVRYLGEYSCLNQDDFMRLMNTEERHRHDPGEMGHIPSCHWTTMMVLWGLAELVANRRSRCVQKGADFLLGRFFQRNPHSNFYQSQKNWTTLKYPNNRCNGLAALSVLTKINRGHDDPRMEKPIDWLISQRYRGGFWTESNRPHMERDQWLTLATLEILARYAEKL
jgi:hypothetical protein